MTFAELLEERGVLLADGATGTNLFERGLGPGDPPEFLNEERPEVVESLHSDFVEAGSDIILTNSFGANAYRLKLHKAEGRARELNRLAAGIARRVADAAGRPVIVAGDIGPTGELFRPLGELEHDGAVAAFSDQIAGLKEGGADIVWIETMSAPEELRAAAEAAISHEMPYVANASFDTAGRTMMGLMPRDLPNVFDGLDVPPAAVGANCGVGASDLLVSLLAISKDRPELAAVAKANCGIPQAVGGHVHYSGTPELMASYARLAVDAGARIVGGCCGTTPVHLAAMRGALDAHEKGERPSLERIVRETGPLVAPAAKGGAPRERRRRRARG